MKKLFHTFSKRILLFILSPTIHTAKCVVQIDDKPHNTTCIPIQGFITVKFAASDLSGDQVEKVIWNYLNRGMKENLFISDTIPKLSFIERRQTLTGKLRTNNRDELLSTVDIVILVVFVVCLFIGVGFLKMKQSTRKRKRQIICTPSKIVKMRGPRKYDRRKNDRSV